jgi:hypothetical protein
MCRCLRRCLPYCCHCGDPHDNNKYDPGYTPVTGLLEFVKTGGLTETFNTLIESNDNLTLKWYYNQLIRLPIKLGTLDFDGMVHPSTLKKYGVNRLSEYASETVERSY